MNPSILWQEFSSMGNRMQHHSTYDEETAKAMQKV